MDASKIELAQNAIELAIRHGADDEALLWFAQAQAYATIAQAEAMQLIAKRLEQFMETQGVGFEVIEAAERGIFLEKECMRLSRRIAELEGEPVESEYAE